MTEDFHDTGEHFSFEREYNTALPITDTNRPDVAFYYDEPVDPINQGDGTVGTNTNTRGLLSHVVDLSGEETASYDERGRQIWEIKHLYDPINGDLVSYKTAIEYDAFDRKVAQTLPDGDRVEYEYNARTLLEKVRGGESANRDATPFIISGIDYIPSWTKIGLRLWKWSSQFDVL